MKKSLNWKFLQIFANGYILQKKFCKSRKIISFLQGIPMLPFLLNLDLINLITVVEKGNNKENKKNVDS